MSKFTHTAKLVEGRTYALLVPNAANPRAPTHIGFENGVAKKISKEVFNLLTENAVDEVTVGTGRRARAETRNKFDLYPIGESPDEEPDDEPAKAPRKRNAPVKNDE